MAKIAKGVILILLIIGGLWFFSLQNQPQILTQNILDQNIASVQATLSESLLLVQLTTEDKTTAPFTYVHAEKLAMELEQQKQQFTVFIPPTDLQKSYQTQISIMNTAIQSLSLINTNNSHELYNQQKILHMLFQKESALSTSL